MRIHKLIIGREKHLHFGERSPFVGETVRTLCGGHITVEPERPLAILDRPRECQRCAEVAADMHRLCPAAA